MFSRSAKLSSDPSFAVKAIRPPAIRDAAAFVILTLFILLSSAGTSVAGTLYVSPTGSNSNSGTLAKPMQTIQYAVNKSFSGDTVILEPGTYTGLGDVDVTFNDVALTIESEPGTSGAVIDCAGSSAHHHQAFIYSGIGISTAPAVLNALTIKDGYSATGTGAVDISDSFVTLSNCTLESNSDVAVRLDASSTVTFQSCTFETNTDGGIDDLGTATFTNCFFSANSAGSGGAIAIENGAATTTISNCQFWNNTATSGTAEGGAITNGNAAVTTVTNCYFWDNTSSLSGGAISNFGKLTVNLSFFLQNSAGPSGSGGAIFSSVTSASTSVSLANCTLLTNDAEDGGAICNLGATVNLTNCALYGNLADASDAGSAIFNTGTATLKFCSIAGVYAATVMPGPINNSGTMTMIDSIVWEATEPGSADIENTGTITVTYSDIETGYTGYGNIEKDPLFADETNNALHLKTGSPCIAEGIAVSGVTIDLDENSRPTVPSMGACEPGGPKGLAAKAANGSVLLTWTAVPHATGYDVYRGTTAGGELNTAVAGDLTGTSYTDTGLTNGTKYYYTIISLTELDNARSAPSSEVSATPVYPAPTLTSVAPSTITAGAADTLITATGTNFVAASVIRWNGTALTTTYVSSTSLTATVPAADLAEHGSFPITVSTPAPGGGTTASKTFSVTVPIPAAPTLNSATPAVGSVTLKWSTVSVTGDNVSYNILRRLTSTAPNGAYSVVGTATGTTTFVDGSVTNDTSYDYEVDAIDSAGTSPPSNSKTAVPTSGTVAFVKTDTTTQGNWKGAYGADGFNVIGDTSANNAHYPTYVTVTPGSHNSGVWTSASLAPNCLQEVTAGSAGRLAGVWYQTTWSIGVNVTGSHQLALYLVDEPDAGYAETITVKNAATGAVLDTRSASSFSGGVYYVWTVSGNVTVTFTSTAGHWAVVNGIFFGGTGSKAPAAPTNVTATASSQKLTVAWTASAGATSYNVYRGTTAGAELTTPVATAVAASPYVDNGLTPGTIYYYKVVAVNAVGGSFASTEASGTPIASATFVKTDTATEGTWKGVYGADGYNVIGDTSGTNPVYPAYATVTPSAHNSGVWAATSSTVNCLQKVAVGSTSRIAGVWYQTTWTMDVNVTGTHQLALYLLDFPNSGYAETITFADTSTGAILDTRSAASFNGGVYEVWNVSGNVTVTLTSTAGHWAVLSGIFFG